MKRAHGLYGVFFQLDGRARWGMERSKRRALAFARAAKGYVTRMDLPSPEARVWDAPTFRVCSEVVADFREGGD